MMGAGGGSCEMVLGGVQFGLDYGITNKTGQVSSSAVKDILLAAHMAGVTQIDTAHGYGDSELAIGRFMHEYPELRFRVITKLSPMAELVADSAASSVLARVDASVRTSMDRLGRRPLATVMLHRASHFGDWGGGAWTRLKELQRQGDIHSLGVSVQTPEELAWALAENPVSIIQLPFNLLDWRWHEARELIREAKRSRVLTIHARSALLQGLLAVSDTSFWHRANLEDSWPVIDWIRKAAERYTDGNIVRLCIEFVRAQDWVDGVVVGVTSRSQLEENVAYFSSTRLSPQVLAELERDRPNVSESTLNPALWR